MLPYTPGHIKTYYNKFTQKYLDIYGDVIQAFRPKHTRDLLHYIATSSGLKRNRKIVDAGCGVCGPAIYFAGQYHSLVDAITISDIQQSEAVKKIKQAGLEKSISVLCGDYHALSTYYKQSEYDAVYFLESLGHSNQPEIAIREAWNVLKPGGFIYIKDFYKKEVDDPRLQAKIDRVIYNIDSNYSYNTLNLIDVIRVLRACNLEIEFVKRFGFNDDTSIRAAFEKEMKIDIFEGEPEFFPAEWLEIKCIKPL